MKSPLDSIKFRHEITEADIEAVTLRLHARRRAYWRKKFSSPEIAPLQAKRSPKGDRFTVVHVAEKRYPKYSVGCIY